MSDRHGYATGTTLTTADAPALLRPSRLGHWRGWRWRRLLGRDSRAARRMREIWLAAGRSTLRAQGQAGDLPVSVGRHRRSSICSTTSRSCTQFGKELPDSIRSGQRLTGMTRQARFAPVAPSRIASSASTARAAPGSASCCRTRRRSSTILRSSRSMHTEAINHDPAITFFQTGTQQPGRPSLGAWLAYGLGSENRESAGVRRDDLAAAQAGPTISRSTIACGAAAFCRRSYQGVKFRGTGDPGAVSVESAGRRPRGAAADARRARGAERHQAAARSGDPEIATRIAQYEMAFRMQTSVPELTDLSDEPEAHLRYVRPRCRQAAARSPQLPAGPATGRARRAVHPALPSRLGPASRSAASSCAASAATPTRRRRRW